MRIRFETEIEVLFTRECSHPRHENRTVSTVSSDSFGGSETNFRATSCQNFIEKINEEERETKESRCSSFPGSWFLGSRFLVLVPTCMLLYCLGGDPFRDYLYCY